MTALVLRVGAPLMSWSGYRHQLNMGSVSPTEALPRKSAITGLLGAALGPVDRGAGCARELKLLGARYELHVRVEIRNPAAEDFQVVGPLNSDATVTAERTHKIATARVKAFPTKRAGGNFPTAVSRRDFLAHAEFIVAAVTDTETVSAWSRAMRDPVFMPYLGRRSCAPTAPLLLGVWGGDITDLFSQLPHVVRHDTRIADPEVGPSPVPLTGYEISGDYDLHRAERHPAVYVPSAVASRAVQLQWVKECLS